jgi:hypothetical protein
MSRELIAHNADLQKLQNEGYELEIINAYLIMHHIPYIGPDMTVKYGMLAAPLDLSGTQLLRPQTHVISFSGEYPLYSDGKEITALRNESTVHKIGESTFHFRFSNKPTDGYPDYYAKFTRYVEIISEPAMVLDPTVTAKTFKPIVWNEDTIFCYEDTNSSRAGVSHFSKKLNSQKVAIIGMGGTGSYILDLIAKSAVQEIHLFDGDIFCQHNAFRSPGAATIGELNLHPKKSDYFMNKYSAMRKGIFSHSEFLSEENITSLDNMDFVFIAIDSGSARKMLCNYLDSKGISYIDSGISVLTCGESLLGTVRATRSTKELKHIKRLYFSDSGDDIYSSNIQIAELNSLAAIFSVLKWKQQFGFYQDLKQYYNSVYDTNDGEIKNEAI